MKKAILFLIILLTSLQFVNAQTYTISGIITDDSNPIQGVFVSFSNGAGTAETNSDGIYSKSVDYGYTGTATPSKAGYTFNPVNRTYTNVIVNQTGEDYTGSLSTVNISGTIVDQNQTPIQGVLLTFTGTGGGSVESNSDGYYEYSVPYNYTGTATPSKSGYAFNPVSRTYIDVIVNTTGESYIGSLSTVNISGTIVDQDQSPIQGVVVTFSNGGGAATTNSDGDYDIDVDYGYSGTATPSKTNYIFDPSFISYDSVTTSYYYSDYIAILVGIQEINKSKPLLSLKIYPNPTQTNTTVEIKSKSVNNQINIIITDNAGKIVKSVSIKNPKFKQTFFWDGKDQKNQLLESGIYHIKVSADDNVSQGSIIISR